MAIESLLIKEQYTLMGIVYMLGIRHGFELDHLAVIDSMIGCSPAASKTSKWMGCLFSLGHGSVVIGLTIIIALEAKKWIIPGWLEGFGLFISIFCLIFFGLYSLYTALLKSRHANVTIGGIKSYLFQKTFLSHSRSTWLTPILTGMLFSLSFDTLSITTAFALNGYSLGGPLLPICLGVIFMLGMMCTDGLNGYFIARILAQAGKRSQILSCSLDLIVGGFSVILGCVTWYYCNSP